MRIQKSGRTIGAQFAFDDMINDDLDRLKGRVDPDVIDALKDNIAIKSRALVKFAREDAVRCQVLRAVK